MKEQVERHTKNAVGLLLEGKLAHAAAEFEHAVRLSPGDLTLRQRLGDVYCRLGLRTHAIREFQHVAGRYAADGHLLKAIAICKVILEIDPEHQEALHTLADLYALQRETLPMVPRLPPSMSAAVMSETVTDKDLTPVYEDSAPLDMESLAVFRDALAGVALPKQSADEEDEATTVQSPRTAVVDLAKVTPSPLFSALDKPAFEALVQKLD